MADGAGRQVSGPGECGPNEAADGDSGECGPNDTADGDPGECGPNDTTDSDSGDRTEPTPTTRSPPSRSWQ